MKTGIELIAQERQEQIEKHGYTIEHDQEYDCEELKTAAIALLTQPKDKVYLGSFPALWNDGICEKMAAKDYKGRLILAGAFVAAEIDRIQHNQTPPQAAMEA